MNKDRVTAILESQGVINVTYKENPVWLESISNDRDGYIQVRNLKTNEHIFVDIRELEE